MKVRQEVAKNVEELRKTGGGARKADPEGPVVNQREGGSKAVFKKRRSRSRRSKYRNRRNKRILNFVEKSGKNLRFEVDEAQSEIMPNNSSNQSKIFSHDIQTRSRSRSRDQYMKNKPNDEIGRRRRSRMMRRGFASEKSYETKTSKDLSIESTVIAI